MSVDNNASFDFSWGSGVTPHSGGSVVGSGGSQPFLPSPIISGGGTVSLGGSVVGSGGLHASTIAQVTGAVLGFSGMGFITPGVDGAQLFATIMSGSFLNALLSGATDQPTTLSGTYSGSVTFPGNQDVYQFGIGGSISYDITQGPTNPTVLHP